MPALTLPAASIGGPTIDEGRLTVLMPCDVAWDATTELASAIRVAAPLLCGQRLLVAAMWRSIAPAAGVARAAMPAGMVNAGVRNVDREQRERAHRCAQWCVAIAQDNGVHATAEVRLVTAGWATSVAAIAHERGAAVVLLAHARRARRLARLLGRAAHHASGSAPLLVVPGG